MTLLHLSNVDREALIPFRRESLLDRVSLVLLIAEVRRDFAKRVTLAVRIHRGELAGTNDLRVTRRRFQGITNGQKGAKGGISGWREEDRNSWEKVARKELSSFRGLDIDRRGRKTRKGKRERDVGGTNQSGSRCQRPRDGP